MPHASDHGFSIEGQLPAADAPATDANVPPPYAREFPDFVLDVAIPADWEDVSWHNDACPCWRTAPRRFLVFVDYLDQALRENAAEGERFSVFDMDSDETIGEQAFASDDWAAVLAFVAGDPAP